MTPKNEFPILEENNLILTAPDTEFGKIFSEVHDLIQREPKILERIEQDLDKQARKKKKMRLDDQAWKIAQNPVLPGMNTLTEKIETDKLVLQKGNHRMPPFVVFLFLIIRGYLGGIKSEVTKRFLEESITLHLFLGSYGLKMPGLSTILDNINFVSNETRQFIFDAQIRMIMNEELDNFEILRLDSTAVEGNTSWPTDSAMMSRLTDRIYSRGRSLDKFGIAKMKERNFVKLIKDMKKISQTIAFEVGKKDSEKKRKKHYTMILNKARRANEKFVKEMKTIEADALSVNLAPSMKIKLIRLVEMMSDDISDLCKVIDYCESRVFENEKTPSNEKVLSLSDISAAYIQKGNREAVIGYKPQLGRSENGFVSVLITPEGNAADSGQLDPAIIEHFRCTKTIPIEISTDDGYANKKVMEKWLEKGVSVFSISGAKGKKMTPVEDWESKSYLDARNGRSAAESLMFHLKHSFHFGRTMRRGIDNVRAELMENVLAYNFCKMIELKRKKLKIAA